MMERENWWMRSGYPVIHTNVFSGAFAKSKESMFSVFRVTSNPPLGFDPIDERIFAQEHRDFGLNDTHRTVYIGLDVWFIGKIERLLIMFVGRQTKPESYTQTLYYRK